MYSNININLGSVTILRANQEQVQDLSFNKRIQSDHVALTTYVQFKHIESLRIPQIQKVRMLKHIKELPGRAWFAIRNDPIRFFKKIRKSMISNKLSSHDKTKIPKVENIQSRLGKKILIFDKKEFEMNIKDRHAMIQAIAKERK